MNHEVGHKCIRAFAGSGKTHALVNRYIQLLALGVLPGRINALTFTRKAAGEFMRKIFLRLTEAADDPGKAEILSGELGMPALKAGDYRGILREMVAEMGDIQLGTIDSYFARLISVFPHELGLARSHRILDDYEHQAARRLAMGMLLDAGDEEKVQRLLQLFKNLTWGSEDKNVYRLFEDRIGAHQSLFLENGDPALWGDLARIFPEQPWWLCGKIDKERVLGNAWEALSVAGIPENAETAIGKILNTFDNWQPGMEFNGGTLFERLLENHPELKNGSVCIKFNRKDILLKDPLCGYLYQLIQFYISGEIERRLRMTLSLGQLIADFDKLYHEAIRETGSLVFADLPMLLVRALGVDGAGMNADSIEYRLDGRVDHWLVDEFQDTSRIQWKVLSAFIDEVIQDPGLTRTFFYVGDVKQSIYTWRGGDPRLFNEVLDGYNFSETVIKSDSLKLSWRSAPPVLDCINILFSKGIREPLVDSRIVSRWEREWQEHKSAPTVATQEGFAGWALVDSPSTVADGCVEVIKSVEPLAHGLSCAVLVRRNKEVLEVTQALRSAGIAASMEGVVHIVRDNLVGCWILAFCYAIARPDEKFPKEYLSSSGFSFPESEFNRLSGLARMTLTKDGYAEFVRKLIEFLKKRFDFSEFQTHRSEQILESAGNFESMEDSSLEEFISFLEQATVTEASLHSQVQVMTVHKSKGLGFDMVIVAGFGQEPVVGSSQESLHVQRDQKGNIQWIMDLPRKQVLQQEPELYKAEIEHGNDLFFESLCLLYVAMTRAKKGLYCISQTPQRNSTQTTWHQLMESAFSGNSAKRTEGFLEWQAEWGNPGWFKECKPESTLIHEIQLDTLPGEFHDRRPMLEAMPSPSREAHEEENAMAPLGSSTGREFGTRMHDFLATINWLPLDDSSALETKIGAADDDLKESIRSLLNSTLGREVFGGPEENVIVWREKPFAMRVGDKVTRGIIDRAHILTDECGKPVSMTIYDFKTDKLDPSRSKEEQLHERYHLQLERYREAASTLTGLPEDSILTKLVPV